MDAPVISARQAALALGTSIPRVKRALERLGIQPERRAGGRVRLTERQLESLRDELGSNPAVPGLSRTEALVLAALSRAPRGLTAVRGVARRAGVSPTAAGRAIRILREKGLVTSERRWVAAGRAREMDVIRANFSSPEWPQVARRLARVRPPLARRHRRQPEQKIPARLEHLFWNTAPSQKDTRHAGGYIARRLLEVGDPEGLAWGIENLTESDWEHAARARGIQPRRRAFAMNLAGGNRQ